MAKTAKQKRKDEEKEFEAVFDQAVKKEVIEDDPNKGTPIGMKIMDIFNTQKVFRRPYEIRWIENLRQYRAIYDPETVAKMDANSSKVYPGLTRAKVNMVLSRLHEMLYPDADRAWEIKPTPVPKIPKEIALMIKAKMVQSFERIPTFAEFQKAINEYAKVTCSDMQKRMDDQLTEMNYSSKIGKPTLKSGILFGHGLVKGPLLERVKRDQWVATENDLQTVQTEELKPVLQFVPVWNHYPDLSVTDWDDQNWQFERHVFNKKQLKDLAKRPDFNGKIITDFMLANPTGNYQIEQWEQELRNMMVSDIANAKNAFQVDEVTVQKFDSDKYVVIEGWGMIDGRMLSEMGVSDIPESQFTDQVQANVWVLGNQVIKAMRNDIPSPDKKPPYHIFYYEKDDSSIFGEGLPRVMRHSQLAVAGAARMLLNNAAICSGPQLEVNTTLIQNEDITAIFPLKVWWREGRGADNAWPALRVYNVDSHITEYISIIEQFKAFGDEETTLPSWLIGDPGQMTNQTVGATSMKMSNVTVTLKDVVRNFDDHTESIIRALYWWNMEFSEEVDIKGDYNVKALGSSSLVTKELRMQALNQLQVSMAPEDWAYLPRREFLEARIKAHDLDITLRTEEEAQQYMAQRQDQRLKELQYRQLEADIRKTEAMALNFGTKAKHQTVETSRLSSGVEDEQPDYFDIMGKQMGLAEMEAKIKAILVKIEQEKAKTESIRKGKSGPNPTKTKK